MPGTENLPKVEANLKEEIEKPSELKHVEVTKFIHIRRNSWVYNIYIIDSFSDSIMNIYYFFFR